MRTPIALLVISTIATVSFAADPAPKIGSTVFTWESRVPHPTGVGERREVSRNPTATLDEFECHISTLNPEKQSHPPHTHPQEELIFLTKGHLKVHANNTDRIVGPGSVFFFASQDPHNVSNTGDEPATYFVFNFATAATAARRNAKAEPAVAGRLGSTVIDWNDLVAKPTKTGERRDLFNEPTLTLANFEAHVTTINPGQAPHASHHHPDEEIVLVKEGTLEVTIKGVTTFATPGSIIFVSSGDEHGWRNAGETPATYYVMRLKTEKTPAAM